MRRVLLLLPLACGQPLSATSVGRRERDAVAAPSDPLVVAAFVDAGPDASSWAVDAAAALSVFDPASPDFIAAIASVTWGNSYVPNAYACDATGTDWRDASATCWLANCSAGPSPFVGPQDCFDVPPEPACQNGNCAVNKWLATSWEHYLDDATRVLNVSSCLLASAAAAWPVADADALAETCIVASGATDFAHVQELVRARANVSRRRDAASTDAAGCPGPFAATRFDRPTRVVRVRSPRPASTDRRGSSRREGPRRASRRRRDPHRLANGSRRAQVHSTPGDEALGGHAMVTAVHLPRAAPSTASWPIVTIADVIYSGDPTAAGLLNAVCDAWAAAGGASPAACEVR